jgi:hypothetical protein
MSNQPLKSEKITLQGLYSKTEIVIRLDVIVELVKSYLVVIPNEKREMKMALKVLRLHEDLNKLVDEEQDAIEKHIDKKITSDSIKEELQ